MTDRATHLEHPLSHREHRVPALLAAALSSCLGLAACTSGGSVEPDKSPSPEYVPYFWVEREVRVRTLDRMLAEGDPEQVVDNIGDLRGRLFDTRVIQEDDDGYRVELDKDEWRPEAVTHLGRLDSALAAAMSANEVTWCGAPVTGEEFVDAYVDEYWETLDRGEAYEESIVDYVDCGPGEL